MKKNALLKQGYTKLRQEDKEDKEDKDALGG